MLQSQVLLSNDVYMGGAGLEDVEMGQIKVFVQELGLKEGFLADTQIWIISLQTLKFRVAWDQQ